MPFLRVVLACGSLALSACGGGGDEPAATAGPGPAPLRIAVVGDSYSNGEGVGLEQSWPAQLARRLGAEVSVNLAVSGWTSQQAIDAELPELERAELDVATLLIGANDLVQRVPPAAFRANVRTLLAELARIAGASDRVLAVTIPDFTVKPVGATFGDLRAGLRRYNAIIRDEAARRGVAVADVVPASRDADVPAPDGLHPAAEELAAWTDAIEPVARRAWAGLLS